MFVYKQLHPAAAIICAVATLTIAPALASIPIPSPMTPTKIALVGNMSRDHRKVGFVARNSDCQARNNDCKPRNHYFTPRNQNKHHLHPCSKALDFCCMGGDGDEGNGCGIDLFIGKAIASSKVVSLPL